MFSLPRLSRGGRSATIKPMERTLAIETPELVGQKVLLQGWVNTRRDHGQLVFVELRDRSGVIQAVGGEELSQFRPEDVIELVGTVRQRPAKTVNPKLATGEVEIQVTKATRLVESRPLPFDLGQPTLKAELPTILDHRPLSLRHSKIKAVFKVQEVIIQSFRHHLQELGFSEFFPPTLVPTATEGGAEVFPVKYFDHWVYLSQSPQFYKQIMVSIFERGFTVAKAYRAEPSMTTRHLTEYVSLDAEFGFISNWTEIMDVAEAVIRHIVQEVARQCRSQLTLLDVTLPSFGKKIPRLKMREAQEIIFKRTGRDHRREPDLDPEDEREICRWAHEEEGSDYVFLTHYPTKKRPFYTFPDPDDPDYTYSFDLIGAGFEWVTGGQRIHDYDQLMANVKKWGNKPADFETYLQAFRYGMPPEGGFAIGAERLTQGLLGLANIREASLFPRDMERVDVRLSTLTAGSAVGEETYRRIISLLEKEGAGYQIFKHSAVTTSQEAARVRGTSLEQGAKAMVLDVEGEAVMAVLSAADTLDMKVFLKLMNAKKGRLMKPERVEELTGLEVGAIPPFGSFFKMPTWVEKRLAKQERIAFNAGSTCRSVMMSGADYQRLESPHLGAFAVSSKKK